MVLSTSDKNSIIRRRGSTPTLEESKKIVDWPREQFMDDERIMALKRIERSDLMIQFYALLELSAEQMQIREAGSNLFKRVSASRRGRRVSKAIVRMEHDIREAIDAHERARHEKAEELTRIQDNGFTKLTEIAAGKLDEEALDRIKEMLEAGADVEAKDGDPARSASKRRTTPNIRFPTFAESLTVLERAVENFLGHDDWRYRSRLIHMLVEDYNAELNRIWHTKFYSYSREFRHDLDGNTASLLFMSGSHSLVYTTGDPTTVLTASHIALDPERMKTAIYLKKRGAMHASDIFTQRIRELEEMEAELSEES